MALKLTVLFAILACATAGLLKAEGPVSYDATPVTHHSAAPAVSYSSFTRTHSPAQVYGYAAPPLSYGHSYAPVQSYKNYGYSSYVSPLATKNFAVAQPQVYHNSYSHSVAPVVANHIYSAPSLAYSAPVALPHASHDVSYDNSYAAAQSYKNYGYSASATPVVTKTVAVTHPQVYQNRYAHSVAPVVADHTYSAPSLAYSAQVARTYASPAVSYDHSYAPAQSYKNYGYSAYAAPVVTKTVAVAQPQVYQNTVAPVVADHTYSSPPLSYSPNVDATYTTPSLSYQNYGQSSYAAPVVSYGHGSTQVLAYQSHGYVAPLQGYGHHAC